MLCGGYAPFTVNLSSDRIPLLGAALGDALGAGVEGGRALQRALAEDEPGVGRRFFPYSPFGFKPGELTDDTQMAWAALVALTEGPLPAATGAGYLARVGPAYRAWLRSHPPDVGAQTYQALAHDADTGGFQAWGGGEGAGNGSLMRATATFVAGYRGDSLLRAAALDSALTHADPRCVAACVWYAATLERAAAVDAPERFAEAVEGGLVALEQADVIAYLEPLGAQVPHAWEAFRSRWVGGRETIRATVREALAGEHVDCRTAPPSAWPTGFVIDSLRQAAWAASQGARADESLRLAVLHGGRDADTIGAIAGGLIGARFGARALEQWELPDLRLGHRWPGVGQGPFLELLATLGRPDAARARAGR
jgi:ADP-ribosylglycohydrolase